MASLRLTRSAALFDDRAGPERAGRPAVADLQNPGADGRRARVGVGAGQRRRARGQLVNVPVPLMSLVTVIALLRFNRSSVLLMTAPVPSVPVVVLLPTCRMPALIVVVPL